MHQRHIRIEPATHTALRTLLGRAIERVFLTGNVQVVRRLRDDARTLEVRSRDGRKYSGILVVHGNEVASGLVVETPPSELGVAQSLAAVDTGGGEGADPSSIPIFAQRCESEAEDAVAASALEATMDEVAE